MSDQQTMAMLEKRRIEGAILKHVYDALKSSHGAETAKKTIAAAVREISFSLAAGSSLGIVGESGSGKTTIARMLVGLETPSAGRIALQGKELAARPSRAERQERARAIQIVFQDPYTSLDPRQSVARVAETLGFQSEAAFRRSFKRLRKVGPGTVRREARH